MKINVFLNVLLVMFTLFTVLKLATCKTDAEFSVWSMVLLALGVLAITFVPIYNFGPWNR